MTSTDAPWPHIAVEWPVHSAGFGVVSRKTNLKRDTGKTLVPPGGCGEHYTALPRWGGTHRQHRHRTAQLVPQLRQAPRPRPLTGDVEEEKAVQDR
jgi:hypothetical protein